MEVYRIGIGCDVGYCVISKFIVDCHCKLVYEQNCEPFIVVKNEIFLLNLLIFIVKEMTTVSMRISTITTSIRMLKFYTFPTLMYSKMSPTRKNVCMVARTF